jgi:hypothetical protein
VTPKIDYHTTPEFFYRLGIIMMASEFENLPETYPRYARRLAEWHAPRESVATVIMAGSRAELVDIIRHSPKRDFELSEKLRDLAAPAAAATHRATAVEHGRYFLLAIDSARRAPTSVDRGAIVADGQESLVGMAGDGPPAPHRSLHRGNPTTSPRRLRSPMRSGERVGSAARAV